MGLTLIKKWLSSGGKCFDVIIGNETVDFSIDTKDLKSIKTGNANSLLLAQYCLLKLLQEQGAVESFPDGFIMNPDDAVRLEVQDCLLLKMPLRWTGLLSVDISGQTFNNNFKVKLLASHANYKPTSYYEIVGPTIKFSQKSQFLLSPIQLALFTAFEKYNASAQSQLDNLYLMGMLQQAQQDGCNINLAHFDSFKDKPLKIVMPNAITINIDVNKDGSISLAPNLGQQADPKILNKLLTQVKNKSTDSLRVGNEIIVLNEKQIKAIDEILTNSVIKKSNVKDFLANPTSYLAGELIDLDVGFSTRVDGSTVFKHAYFGEIESSGLDWFAKSDGDVENIYPISTLPDFVNDLDSILEFEKRYEDAKITCATTLLFEGRIYDISNAQKVASVIKGIKASINEVAIEDIEDGEDTEDSEFGEDGEDGSNDSPTGKGGDVEPPISPVSNEKIVVNIALNDESLDSISTLLEEEIDIISYNKELDWNNYQRKPFAHQESGIRWILGLHQLGLNSDHAGGLLADDMGLGKTYMALSAIDHISKVNNMESSGSGNVINKPTLVVAPLGLLNNWKDEVSKTFINSPFKDIVILQSDNDLSKFKIGGSELRSSNSENNTQQHRISLKVGKGYGDKRLDQPGRLVITNYHTLSNYQFSMCSIDWGMVIFDEAQNIKNPNTLQTRAAKGLKSTFKLLATGTPVENSLAEFWCLLDTVSPGRLSTYQSFRRKYISPIKAVSLTEKDIVRENLGVKLRADVGGLMLRRTKEDSLKGLPLKKVYVGIDDGVPNANFLPELKSIMVGEQLDTYSNLITNFAEEGTHVLAALSKLQAVSLHSELPKSNALGYKGNSNALKTHKEQSGKISSLIFILDKIKQKNEKCIIFCINKKMQLFLNVFISSYYKLPPISILNGDTKTVSKSKSVETRNSMIADFESKPGFNVIIMSPIAAGVGLTVVGANHVVHFERHWNPAKEAQATDRVYRIGQEKDVNVYMPLLHHPVYESFDINLHRLLSNKLLIKDAVVTSEKVKPNPNGLANAIGYSINAASTREMTWEHFEAYVVELFSLDYDAQDAYLTNKGRDNVIDGLLFLDSGVILIQAKHTTKNKTTFNTYSDINQFAGTFNTITKKLNKKIVKTIFVTNYSMISKDCKTVAKDNSIDIYSLNDLRSVINKHKVSSADIYNRLSKQRYKTGF